MFRGAIGNVVLAPISEVLARLLVQAAKTVLAAKDVLIERESFTELSRYLERLRPILGELSEKSVQDTPAMRTALESIEQQLQTAKQLMASCSGKSRFYLLMQCRTIVKEIQDVTQELGRCLSLIPMATLDVSIETRLETEKLMKVMEEAHFKAAVAEEEIIEKIESGIRDRQMDSDFANVLLLQIAEAVGVSAEPHTLKQELLEFRKEKEEVLLRKSQAEAVQLEQIIALLSRADAATTQSEKFDVYKKKRDIGGGAHQLSPLHSFYCPITREVMEEPVEIASGQTFEKSAILTWFRSGNQTCPITKADLTTLEVKPNQALRQSIEEWRERNIAISIAATGPRLRSGREQDVLDAIRELHRLSDEKSQHRYWIASEGLIPVLVELLNTGQRNVRSKTLAVLRSLCVNNDNNKEVIAEAGAIKLAVRSLARDVVEGRQSVGLLLELSSNLNVAEQIGKVQGCILLLVTMLNSDNHQAVEDARKLLDNLSRNDQNVVQMAEANHFEPLLQRLVEGDNTRTLFVSHFKFSPTKLSNISRLRSLSIGGLVINLVPDEAILKERFQCHLAPPTIAGKVTTSGARGHRNSLIRRSRSRTFRGKTSKSDASVASSFLSSASCDMTKILMATALARLVLTDQGKESLAREGAVGPLVQMLTIGKLEAKSAALGALENLSILPEIRAQMITAGVIPPLLQLLFSVTSVVMSLKEQAAATLANLAQASTAETKIDEQGNILESDETIYQLLSLLNLAGAVIQGHLLRALVGMSALPSAILVRNKLRAGGAIQLLLPFCETEDDEVRVNAVTLLWYLSGDGNGKDMTEYFGRTYIEALVHLLNDSLRDDEKAAAVGIIGNLPASDSNITHLLLEADALRAISNILTIRRNRGSSRDVRNLLLENSASAIIRFCWAHDIPQQKMVAELDVIPKLVRLLGSGTPLAKQRAAFALSQFSENSSTLSVPIAKPSPFWCGCLAPRPELGCRVHGGLCSVKTSFCLIAGDALVPLVQTLEERESGAAEAALGALTTLVQDDKWENGVHAIADAQGINPIVRVLTTGSPGAKDKAVSILERIFRIEKYRLLYGSSAQMPLIDLTQKGSNTMKPAAARILAHLNILHNQSTYF